jgi:hypothetical protein
MLELPAVRIRTDYRFLPTPYIRRMLFEPGPPMVCSDREESDMKKMFGLALITGLLAAGCRPLALPVPTTPLEPVPTTTQQTGPDPAANPNQPPDPTETGPSSTPPVVDIDLGQLDDLLSQLDSALADVDGAMQEGDEQ